MTQISLKQQAKNLTGVEVEFDRIEPKRGHPPLTYVYIPARGGMSILKFQGELPPSVTPSIRGAQQWAQRRTGRQATLSSSGSILLLEEADD